MRFLLSATRALIALATSAHLIALRGTVSMAERRANKAMSRTDTATLAVSSAKANLTSCKSAEKAARDSYRTLRIAANEEAASLRRGAVVG